MDMHPSKRVSQYLLPVLALGAWLISGEVTRAQTPQPVNRIVIESDWAGLGPMGGTKLLVQRQANGFVLTGTLSDREHVKPLTPRKVDAADIEQLVAAMQAPAQQQVPLQRLVPDPVLLLQSVEGMNGRLGWTYRSPRQRAAIEKILRDPERISEVIRRGYDSMHTDDYPSVEVRVTLADGTVLTATSHSQHFLMLPWERKPGGATWSSSIADTLWKLMPGDATNRSRLGGPGGAFDLEEIVSDGLSEPMHRIAAEESAGAALRQLEVYFTVDEVELLSPDEQHPELMARLRWSGAPPNLSMFARVPIYKGALLDGDVRIRMMLEQFGRVIASSEIAAAMKAAPNEQFQTNFFQDKFYDEIMSSFLAQLKAQHRMPDLVAKPELLRDAAIVHPASLSNKWLVLRDGRTVDW